MKAIRFDAKTGEVATVDVTPAPEYDNTARTVTTYDETGAVATRPYTAAENAAADAAAAQAAQQQVAATLQADTKTDLDKIATAITKLAVLLGDETTTGSVRAVIGPSGATAGTGSLRALRTQTNTNVINAASIKALIGLVIDLAQLVIDDAQATRRTARQVQRLALQQTGTLTSADVGTDT